MSRSARLTYPGGVFHVISRCLFREPLLDGEDERGHYLTLLSEASQRTDARVLSYCLMSNHLHLIIRAGDEPLSRLMQRVHTGYARWKNRRAKRMGPVFADRYRAILVETESYLLELIRYVHLNPVRARVVSHPGQTTWSSHTILAGAATCPEWLDADFVWRQFSGSRADAQKSYVSFVEDGLASERSSILSGDQWLETARELWKAAGHDLRVSDPILGSDEFVKRVLAHVEDECADQGMGLAPRRARRPLRPQLDDLIDLICDAMKLEREEFDERPQRRLPQHARQVLARIWVKEYGRRQLELARLMRTYPSAVSRWYSHAITRLDEVERLSEEIVARLAEIERGHELVSGEDLEAKRIVRPRQEPGRITFNVELLEDRTEIVDADGAVDAPGVEGEA